MSESNPQTARRRNLRKLVASRGGPGALAKALGLKSGSYLSQILSGNRELSEFTARQWEQKLHLPKGWFDIATTGSEPASPISAGQQREIAAMLALGLAEVGRLRHPETANDALEMLYTHAAAGGLVDMTYVRRLVQLLVDR